MLYFRSLFLITIILVNISKGQEDERVANGEDAVSKQFPHQVLILTFYEDNKIAYCSGSILNEEWVLTAAHCLEENLGKFKLIAVAGDIYASEKRGSVGRKVLNSTKWFQHELFSSDGDIGHDIALIKLSEKLTFNEFVQPIARAVDDLKEGTRCTASGWGLTEKIDVSDVLRWGVVETLSHSVCERVFKSTTTKFADSQYCVGDRDKTVGPCSGDSGSPLTCLEPTSKKAYVHGVLSYGSAEDDECGQLPVVYTKVASFDAWINEIIKNNTAVNIDENSSRSVVTAAAISVGVFLFLCLTITAILYLRQLKKTGANKRTVAAENVVDNNVQKGVNKV